MKSHRRRRPDPGHSAIGGDSWAGYSDLMAGLLLLFIFITALKDFQLQEKFADPSKALKQWREAIQALCTDPELKSRGLAPDCETGTIELEDQVFFPFASAELGDRGKANIRDAVPIILDKLRGQPEVWDRLHVEIRGHADPVVRSGKDQYSVNLVESGKRAERVLLFLTNDEAILPRDRGDLKRIAVASAAAHMMPPEDCDTTTAACRTRMRRVEIHLRFDDMEVIRDLIDLLEQLLGGSRA